MERRLKAKAIVAAALLAVVAIALFLPQRPDRFERELMAAWKMNIDGKLEPSKRQAKAAVDEIGTNAIPLLLDWIQTDTRRASYPRKWVQKATRRSTSTHLRWLRRWAFATYKLERAEAAVWAFQLLGRDATPAIPSLMRIATTNTPAARRAQTAMMAIDHAQ